MKTVQLKRLSDDTWENLSPQIELQNPLVLVLGNRYILERDTIYNEIRQLFPSGHLVFGSTCGDIASGFVDDQGITVTAIEFERTRFDIKSDNLKNSEFDSFDTGKKLMSQLDPDGLKYVFVISEGSQVNGSELTKGMNAAFNHEILITGGLCGDGERFEKTLASYNENPKEGEIVAIGFYGDDIEVSFSIHGGWTPFGPERLVTKSKANELFELDHKPALDLYKKYLGDKANDLPGAALLYPLNVKSQNEKHSIVRSILNIDKDKNTMILAGDIPEGSKVQLMMTNVDNIANASELAARQAMQNRKQNTELALLVSCIGRKLVLDQRVEEEIEEVIDVVGENATISGFYSYGEIAPFNGENNCQLHNQTMTITLISE
ncbi:FIST signal transduction protein [Psychroserpens sp. XS_ASV72]|uniref:FIST signal transduction protein n=1 Tax=Psychroserpens sp. XS_ASV72 TaxID=3241293 RepID=UPI003517CC37